MVEIGDVTPTLRRVVIQGDELRELDQAEPGGAVRLLLPPEPDRPVEQPVWNGNAYFAEDGTRPPIRTVTPLEQDLTGGRVAIEIVRHDGGLLTPWADDVAAGGEVAMSGPSRGFVLDPPVRSITYAGDEAALPAIRQLVAVTPDDVAVTVFVEVPGPASEAPMPAHRSLDVRWLHTVPDAAPGDAVVTALAGWEVSETSPLWAAGEAAAMQRLRTDLFKQRQLPRSVAHVRGYWKHGRSEADEE